MEFAERLKELRKAYGLSQEKLAERLNVSRQAVTKWETGAGYPETESLIALADTFCLTVDELLRPDRRPDGKKSFLYESVTQYDVDRKKRFDIKLGAARNVTLCCLDSEKLQVKLMSDSLENIKTDLKIKIDDIKNRTDVDLYRFNSLTETRTKNELDIFIALPASLYDKTEIYTNARQVEIRSIKHIEFDGKAEKILLTDTEKAELNCGCDADIVCKNFVSVDVNQISCTSRLGVTDGTAFKTVKKGIGNKFYFETDGKQCEPFSVTDAQSTVELNGIKSELVIYKL